MGESGDDESVAQGGAEDGGLYGLEGGKNGASVLKTGSELFKPAFHSNPHKHGLTPPDKSTTHRLTDKQAKTGSYRSQ